MNKNVKTDILLVEDSLDDAEMAIRILKKNELTKNIVHVEDGAEALDYIFGEGAFAARQAMKLPKMLILDLNMPKVNGVDVLRKLKFHKETRQIPVVVFTSSKEDSDVRKCYELGVNSYTVKPVKYKEFTQTLSKISQYWLHLNHQSE